MTSSDRKRPSAAVIGANGYIGRNLAKVLRSLDWRVYPYSKGSVSADNLPQYQHVDITRRDSAAGINYSVDVIFFFAGLTGTTAGFERFSEFLDVNERGLLNVLDCMRKERSKARLVFPSSRLVYLGRERPLKEDDELFFKSIYAVNKFAGESYLKLYGEFFGIDYSIFRICVPYGNLASEDYSYGTIGYLLSRATRGENIRIFGDGRQKRSFIHIEDLSRILIMSSTLPETRQRVFNVGGPDALAVAEAAARLAEIYEVEVEHVEWPAVDLLAESGDTVFDSSRLGNILGYRYRHSFGQWIEALKGARLEGTARE